MSEYNEFTQTFQYQTAISDFREARRKAALKQIMGFLKGETDELLSYEEVRQKLKGTGRSVPKLREIPLDAIIGSVGRYSDFTRQFLPRTDSGEQRWANVQTAATSPSGVPAIEVYQLGDAYFVLDGNHRVSVARQAGTKSIEAYVTRIQTKVPLSPDISADELELKAEYAEFLNRTRLDELRPEVDLSMTVSGKYRKLEQQIEQHRHFMGIKQQREIAYQEAVADWYDTVYLPLAQMIEERKMLQEFPERTLTDLYVWISKLRGKAARVGVPTAATYVDEMQANVADSPVSQLEELIIQAEYMEFLEHTHLDELRPKADLRVTVPGKYPRLEEHIEVHRYFMGNEQQREVPYEEAVTHWYDTVYKPMKQNIREQGILRDFPERTATDLYLWIAEHQAELEKQLGWKIAPEKAASDLARRFSPKTGRFIARVGEKIRDILTPDEFESGPVPGQWRKEYWACRRDDRLFSSILVPISGEPQGWCALDQAIRFGRPKGSRVYGLYIVPSEEQQHDEQARAVQAEFEQRCQTGGIQGDFAIETGKVARKICERAVWTDVIMLSLAHPPGPQPLAKLKSGFRTILRRCSRPLLAVPGTATNMERALLAYDGSPKADEALFLSAYLAGCWGISLVVMTVSETGWTTSKTLSLAEHYLHKQEVQATCLEERISERGSVGKTIIQVAREQECDFIMMGGYGRSPVLEIMLGSAVDYVLRESRIPVLICR